MLGYTPISWDNLIGEEQQPWSLIKSWVYLTDQEKAAAWVLGYAAISWDNDSGAEPQPASLHKDWAELSACADGEIFILRPSPCYRLLVVSVCLRLEGLW